MQPVCRVSPNYMPVTRLGLVRVHGPVSDRCPGSRNPPAHDPPPDPYPSPTFNPIRPAVKILKRIPRASRDLSVRKLASILDEVTKDNSPTSWDHLFSLAFSTNQLIEAERDLDPAQTAPGQPRKRPQQPIECLATRISTKLEEGDFKGAVRLASSEDSIADLNEETLASLRD